VRTILAVVFLLVALFCIKVGVLDFGWVGPNHSQAVREKAIKYSRLWISAGVSALLIAGLVVLLPRGKKREHARTD
jgi:hypothetical protein